MQKLEVSRQFSFLSIIGCSHSKRYLRFCIFKVLLFQLCFQFKYRHDQFVCDEHSPKTPCNVHILLQVHKDSTIQSGVQIAKAKKAVYTS